jgi:hypothetical protein
MLVAFAESVAVRVGWIVDHRWDFWYWTTMASANNNNMHGYLEVLGGGTGCSQLVRKY